MKLFLMGSSQTKHISEIYKDCGWEVKYFVRRKHKLATIVVNLIKILGSDVIYNVGNFFYRNNNYLIAARIFRKKVIVHWIGSDVLTESREIERKGKTKQNNDIHLAVSKDLQRELEEMSIKSFYVPIVPSTIPYPPAFEMPKKHAALAYLPKGNETFYGWEKVKLLAKMFPDIPFYIVANDGICEENIPENIVFEGMLPHEQLMELYKKTSVLLRLTAHDGLPVMAIEAQGFGRKVICSFGLPYAITPEDASDDALLQAFEELISTPPVLDLDAKRYVDEIFSHINMVELYKRNGLA